MWFLGSGSRRRTSSPVVSELRVLSSNVDRIPRGSVCRRARVLEFAVRLAESHCH